MSDSLVGGLGKRFQTMRQCNVDVAHGSYFSSESHQGPSIVGSEDKAREWRGGLRRNRESEWAINKKLCWRVRGLTKAVEVRPLRHRGRLRHNGRIVCDENPVPALTYVA
jgi:hypothetical protein